MSDLKLLINEKTLNLVYKWNSQPGPASLEREFPLLIIILQKTHVQSRRWMVHFLGMNFFSTYRHSSDVSNYLDGKRKQRHLPEEKVNGHVLLSPSKRVIVT